MKFIRARIMKHKLLGLLAVILIGGFLAVSLISFYVSLSYLRRQISITALPLTSDNIFSEIQQDIIRPIYISSVMAHNTFLRDWIRDGEQDVTLIAGFLSEIKRAYGTFTSFYVSERTRNYYYPEGILKQVREDEERDIWYFRVREMEQEYEINIDPDLANKDEMTVFINHRVYDYDGNYIGATGIGLATHSVLKMVESYRERFDSDIYFVAPDGTIVLRSDRRDSISASIFHEPGLSPLASDILDGGKHAFRYTVNGERLHVNSRFIPELNWFLLVTQSESESVAHVYTTLTINLILCVMVTVVVLALTALAINAYQRVMQRQQDEILSKHQELERRNEELQTALSQVKKLSGLLPICAACKKVRDDQGYWRQIETYIRDHSEASFSHSICPECRARLYPDIEHIEDQP